MYLEAAFVLLQYLLLCQAAAPNEESCQDVYFTFNVTSIVRDISSQHPDLSSPGSIEAYRAELVQKYATALNTTRKATYTLAATYCTVPNTNASSHPLQLLVHGSSYTKEYWHRGAWGTLPLNNSWTAYALSQNYSTLAIDRLCNGASSHPDPQLDCQLSTSTEILHTLVSALRAGNASKEIPISKNITYVGHSAGSIAGANLVQAYPDDIDALVLTGYPSGPIAAIGAAVFCKEHGLPVLVLPPSTQHYRPAYLADPKRFAGLDQGYIASTNKSARALFYAGGYDPSFPDRDFESRGSSPLGEASYTGVLLFEAYKGRVLVLTGDLDGAILADGDAVARTKARFPAARSFDWVNVQDTGHDVNFHRKAPGAYREVFELLRG
ncbi:MAG: hypothetical protein Q9221_009082 [Calogaya cf. arnoldii]